MSLPRQLSRRVQVFGAQAPAPAGASEAARPEAVALLTEILARLHEVDMPLVQFVPACPASGAGRVARDFAVAAAVRLGRTLLLSPRWEPGEQTLPPTRTGRVSGGADAIVPDTSVPGLYYRQADDLSAHAMQANVPDTQPFRLVVIASAVPSRSPAALTCARYCHGSVITVAAGVTRLPELQATVRQVRHAGATVLGTVLFDAPRFRLPFGMGRAA